MKKKLLKVVVAACTLALGAVVMAGCSSGSGDSSTANTTAPEADTSGDISTLVVGFDNSYPPYGYIGEDGEYTGFDLDLAAKVAEMNGWEFVAQPIDWDSKDAELGSGNINCIWNGFTMEGREGDYTFSEPYMLNEQVVVVKADSDIKTLADLAGKVVITQAGGAADELFEGEEPAQAELAATFARLDTIADYNNAFMQLDSGTVDAVACDLSIAAYQMSANPDKYVQLDESLSSEHYAVGFKKGDEALAQKVTDSLKALYEDGTVSEICAKYADQGLSEQNWILK